VDAGVLRERLNARVTDPKYSEWDQAARELGMTGVEEMVAAAARELAGTLLLRSDRLTPAELADEVLARAGLRQVHQDRKRLRKARSLVSGAVARDKPGDIRWSSRDNGRRGGGRGRRRA
jgi:hypothetical protein